MLCGSICVCLCFCVCVGGCSSQSTRPSTRVGCLCGEVWTNVLLQISKITVIRNSFLFASYSLLPFSPYTEVFFMPHVAIDVVRVSLCACVCFRVCCVFYSLALYSKWCPAAFCVSSVHQLVWSACLRRFLLLFTGRGIGIEHWNRPDRNTETDICLMLMRIPSVPLSSVHCQHGSFCCVYNERRSEELRMFQSICRCWHPISFTNFTMQQYVGFRQPPIPPENSLCSVDFTEK